LLGRLPGGQVGDHPAISEHHHPIPDRADLVQPVADEDDDAAGRRVVAGQLQDVLGLGRSESGRRLVEDQHAWAPPERVQDSGLTINPGELQSLMEGGMIHGLSRTFEQVAFTKTHVTSLDWVTYPILRFKDAPNVTAAVITNPALQPKGGGEEVHDNMPSAIANAFFDATGVRLRHLPFTPANVRATLKAAGVA
jgi:hypothetical protein